MVNLVHTAAIATVVVVLACQHKMKYAENVVYRYCKELKQTARFLFVYL